jgi:poly [ADP-ribose] polymerase
LCTREGSLIIVVQVLQSVTKGDYRTWTRWGRVGESGQTAWLGSGSLDDAISHFEKKFKDKSGHKWDNRLNPPKKGKYTFIERNYEEDSDHSDDDTVAQRRGSKASNKTEMKAVSSTLAKPVQDLMELIFNQQYFAATMSAMSYDANKLPLGKLSKRTLKSGFEALKQLAELLANPSLAVEVHNMPYGEALQELSNSYYTYIPHSFGRNRPPIVNNDDMLKREVELLESLSDMSIAEEIMKTAKEDVTSTVHPIDRQYAGLGMAEMTPCKKHVPKKAFAVLIYSQWSTSHRNSRNSRTTC